MAVERARHTISAARQQRRQRRDAEAADLRDAAQLPGFNHGGGCDSVVAAASVTRPVATRKKSTKTKAGIRTAQDPSAAKMEKQAAISSASESDDERGAEEEGGQGSERWSKGRIDEEEEIGDFVIRATTSV